MCERGIIFFKKKKVCVLPLRFLQSTCEAGCGDHWGTPIKGNTKTPDFSDIGKASTATNMKKGGRN